MKLETIKNSQISLFKYPEPLNKKLNFSKREKLYWRFSDKLILNQNLSRAVVSFQDNKKEPFYRWLKFKEGFSSKLVRYLLAHFNNNTSPLRVLDPFAGSGTTLTTAIREGHSATGIELLPVGTTAVRARFVADSVDIDKFEYSLTLLRTTNLDDIPSGEYKFPHLRITKNAFNSNTESSITNYMTFINSIEDGKVKYLFWFACLSILEEISYTSKDGQYLRWDQRSGRALKSKYLKKNILSFDQAIFGKLQIILEDLKKCRGDKFTGNMEIIEGSCLDELQLLNSNSFDLVITSPPYCNRYDYTRTYALELAFLEYSEQKIKDLRQTLLSSTVENKTKKNELYLKYTKQEKNIFYHKVLESFEMQDALHEVLSILRKAGENGNLNNKNIPNMVENYFFEMNIVIHELSRILVPGGKVYMVNDNVQYLGEEVPVDLILSNLAEFSGMQVECIWVLPSGKGNSSQQMGQFGRNEIRKCIYVWSKPTT